MAKDNTDDDTSTIPPAQNTERPDAARAHTTKTLFDLDKLRLSQNYDKEIGVKKLLTHVPVRKPSNQEWVRVNADAGWSLSTQVLTLKAERETYLVTPELWSELQGMLRPVALVVAVTRQGACMVWPLRLPRADGRLDLWGESELEAAERAKATWTRLSANLSSGLYDIFQAAPGLSEPEWPAATFDELIHLAFKGKFIESADHAVLRALRGEM